MFESVSDMQTGHVKKMNVHQNITAFKETHVFTPGNISEYVCFQNMYQPTRLITLVSSQSQLYSAGNIWGNFYCGSSCSKA